MATRKRKHAITVGSRNPFRDRAGAQRFVQRGFDDYRKDYLKHKKLLEKSLEAIELEARATAGKKIPVSLVEARATIISALKTLQTNYTRFLLDITKSKNLLSNLDQPESYAGLVVNLVLQDLGVVPVVEVAYAAPPRARVGDDDSDSAGEIVLGE